MYQATFQPFLDRYNLTLDTMEDWSIGLAKLAKKFGATFSSYKFDGKEALG